MPNKNDHNQNDMNRQNQQNADRDLDKNKQGGLGQQQGGNAGQQSGQRQSGKQIDDNQDDMGRDVNQPDRKRQDDLDKPGRSGA